jgi:hypothetical protein
MLSSTLLVLTSLLLAADAQPRSWTDKDGQKIAEATLSGVEGGAARLKTADGETLVVSLELLSDADRAYIDSATPRVWALRDGTTIEGVLVKKSGVQVHFKDKDQQTHIIAHDTLTGEDRRKVDEQLRRMRMANPRFVRVLRNRRSEPEVLETSIARYVPADGSTAKATVDLISAVHVADGAYYDQLNEEFKKYDVVLYELVAPKDKAVPQPGQDSRNTLADVQKVIRDLLQFEYQLDGVDYRAENFVHADMTPDDLSVEMRKRGETPLTMFLRMFENLKNVPEVESKPLTEEDVVLMLFRFAKSPTLSLRRMMAGQMEDVEGFVAVFEHPEGSTILSGRNDAALRVLREQIDGGKQKIAIFYGAGHMPDLERKLERDFGLKLESERWVPAWNMRDDAKLGLEEETR